MINGAFGNTMGFGQPTFQQTMPYNPYMAGRQQADKINWIQGEEEAKSYSLAPNSNVALIDGNKNILYLKSCDSMGMCTLKAFAVTELEENKPENIPQPDMSDYVRRDEFEKLKEMINNIGGDANDKFVSADNGRSGKRGNSGNSGNSGEN